ncbi:MAG: class I SAM-dependent methyltransferase [Patescibacteria group bacterium]
MIKILKNVLALPEIKTINGEDDLFLTVLHAKIIQRKRFLKNTYIDFYQRLKERLPPSDNAMFVELGSGGGFIKEVIPRIITSDILALPMVDRCFSATAMPFDDCSIDAFLLVDVLHHIADPRAFFNEAQRCLKPRGKILMIEEANTLWGRFIYQYFHHEPFDLSAGWELQTEGLLSRANGALSWIIFSRDKAIFAKEFPSLVVRAVTPHTPFRYLISGGVSMRQLLPSFCYPLIKGLEILLAPFNAYLGMFVTVEVEKK